MPYAEHDFTAIQEANEENEKAKKKTPDQKTAIVRMNSATNHLQMKMNGKNMKVLLFCTMM